MYLCFQPFRFFSLTFDNVIQKLPITKLIGQYFSSKSMSKETQELASTEWRNSLEEHIDQQNSDTRIELIEPDNLLTNIRTS